MFSPIECRLKPSRLSQVIVVGPVILMGVLAGFNGLHLVWLVPALGVTLYTLRHSQQLDYAPAYLRWQGERVLLATDPDRPVFEPYRWSGRGRRNTLYVDLELMSQDNERYDARIWRDSVTDASWRALNAAFRVNAQASVENRT